MIRKPAVAGSFYPGTKASLENQLGQMITFADEKKRVIGLVSPHAGYVYSGGCAGKGFGAVQVPDHVIILGVNHRGMGASFAVDDNDSWNTPLGNAAVDKELAHQLVEGSEIFEFDSHAGAMEHSLEVQVPFIQYINSDAEILPITISSGNPDKLLEGGREIARVIEGRSDVLIVASTDMSHYIDAETAKILDGKAINAILALDPEALFNVVMRERISMCGVGPTTMMLSAALELGAETAEVVQYTNSGEVSGDFYQVVGYVSITVH